MFQSAKSRVFDSHDSRYHPNLCGVRFNPLRVASSIPTVIFPEEAAGPEAFQSAKSRVFDSHLQSIQVTAVMIAFQSAKSRVFDSHDNLPEDVLAV